MSLKDPSNLFFISFFSFCSGIFLGAHFSFSPTFFVGALGLSLVSASLYSFFEKKYRALFLIFVFLSVVLGNLRLHMVDDDIGHKKPGASITGRVTTNPVEKFYNQSPGQSFEFKTDIGQKLLIRSTSENIFVYNDRLKLEADCSTPKNFETDLGSTFDYVTYLKKDHIYFICETNQAELLSHKKSAITTLYAFSNKIGTQIERAFKSPHNAFVGGILVGDKTTITPEIRNDFIKTGTIHMLALSGYNIAIVALFFQNLFSFFFRRKTTLILSGLSVILFVSMTGFAASAIRAGIMALIVIFASFTYQKYSAARALFFASFLMILFDPFYLLYDSSFHLSFLATYGVVVFSPVIAMYLHRIKNKYIRLTVATTLGAYIITLPYLMYFFEGLSLTGIVANIVILPLIPFLMLISALALGMSFISIPISFVPAVMTEYLSQAILSFVHLFAQVPFGYVSTSISVWVCVGLYIGILYGIYYLQKKAGEPVW